jgi:amino acid transporter
MWNYMGWDYGSTVAGEVDRPQRTYPLAMAGSVILVAVTYALPVGAVALSGIGAGQWSTGGWADVARAVFHGGPAGAAVAAAVTLGGMIGAVGTLNAMTLSYSRLPLVMAEDGFLPRVFTRRTPRGAPWVSILACSAAWVLCLGLSFVKLIVLDVLLTGLSLLLEFAALAALRLREPGLPRPYRIPGGLAGAIAVGIFPCALLALTAVRNQSEPVGPLNALELGLLLIAAGVVAYFVGERSRRNPPRIIREEREE